MLAFNFKSNTTTMHYSKIDYFKEYLELFGLSDDETQKLQETFCDLLEVFPQACMKLDPNRKNFISAKLAISLMRQRLGLSTEYDFGQTCATEKHERQKMLFEEMWRLAYQ